MVASPPSNRFQHLRWRKFMKERYKPQQPSNPNPNQNPNKWQHPQQRPQEPQPNNPQRREHQR